MFSDVTKHPHYVGAQSLQWCNQLAAKTGKYEFSWNYVYEGKSAESILTDKLTSLVHGKVLDVGCGHGEYTVQWSDKAEEIVGYDMTEGFIATANRNRKANVRYVLGRTHDGLPFPDDYFDMAYTKKGPTSWYDEGNRIVRSGGKLILLHPGDANEECAELSSYFPVLFSPPGSDTPVLNKIQQRLEASGLTDIEMTVIKEIVWIPTAEDIFEMVCFGQSDEFRKYVRQECYKDINSQFEKHSTDKGIKTTGFYYFIQATAT